MAIRVPMRILWAVALRTWRKIYRRPVLLVFSLVQPLMWMTFFGFLFHRYALEAQPGSPSYLEYLLPGVCGMTVLFGASQSGVGLIRDMQNGFLNRILRTPAPSSAIFGGKLAADVTRLILQAAAVCLLGLILGARLSPSILPLLVAITHLALFAFVYSSISCWIALKTRSQEVLGVFIQAINMPIFFTSTALVPSRQMPDWLGEIAHWNPLSAVVDGLRNGLIFGQPDAEFHHLLVLLGIGGVAFGTVMRVLVGYRASA